VPKDKLNSMNSSIEEKIEAKKEKNEENVQPLGNV
jgi:hypothetical protein